MMKTLYANKTQIVLFTESLIHAGGTCSMEGDKLLHDAKDTPGLLRKADGSLYTSWFGNGRGKHGKQPTDIAFQFTFMYTPTPCVADVGTGSNIWYMDEADTVDQDEIRSFKTYLEEKGLLRYRNKINNSFPVWIQTLLGKYMRGSRKRSINS